MSRQRFAFAWIACFAVLFNMLAMSTAGAMAESRQNTAEPIIWSSFCTSTGTKMVAVSLGKFESGDSHKNDHSTMQHCWCCSGSATQVALPGHVLALHFAALAHAHGQLPDHLKRPTPRQQWPSLNPRAPPQA